MSGNVSEMISEKGIVKGGSWKNRADYLRIDKQQYVYSASPEVGFRYVVEIVELPQPKKQPKPLVLNKKFFKQLNFPNASMQIVGSYRRGAKSSGDIDVIITDKEHNPDLLNKFIDKLVQEKIILHKFIFIN